ncbi:aminopeptidase P family protein [Pseudomonas sp. CFBP 8770]|uniref:aminopeptidase P family protein n=1 Tax=unclassified Pseudomonas TaxID=196821 RepID=UPI00177BF731|nr:MULTISPECIES: aminopeptidase P family protein [unclassified Pseudomonas]MBD8473673.1 aminopeptidase P family protein [Pseudomonas sp. CFBP 8773]MBD8646800.1 aminopeptidase P family protein [Pseudomonas sp. CFBP 8770]
MSLTPSASFPVAERLRHMRALMLREGIDALLVPSADPHLSEYLPEHWQARQWLSGFQGSVGTLIVTPDFAGLWADSRYWEQARVELADSGIELVKLIAGQPGPLDWLGTQVRAGGTVAVDGAVMAIAAARQLREKLQRTGASLRTDTDLFAQAWPDRPALPVQPVYAHAAPYAVRERGEKLKTLREQIQAHGAQWHLLATLDDIAWLFDLRGSDVPYNPVFVAFALIGERSATLFTAGSRVDTAVRDSLAQDGIEVREYADIASALAAVPVGEKLLLDPARVTVGIIENLGTGVALVEALNPTTLSKSRKTAPEAEHIRHAMEQDGAALCEFFAWLEGAWGRERITELTIDEQLTAARARRPNFVSLSFSTIAAFNANGAMPHYRATEQAHAVIEGDGLLLIDSGGQYLGGTTDITRMIPVGTPTAQQRADCTRVLQGMIALSRATFPKGILSPLLDAIARAPIWADQVDYGHGTGHGVGYFMNVHEGPQVIAYQAATTPQTAMLPGMITSIEPGTYRPGCWGVRIENLVLTREAGQSDFGQFLDFETLTLCPIDTRCIDVHALSTAERRWLNDYHAEVERRVAPLLAGVSLQWLRDRTLPV